MPLVLLFLDTLETLAAATAFVLVAIEVVFLQQQQILFFAMDKPPPVTRLALAILTSVLWGYIFSPITSCASILHPNYLKFQFQISFSLLCFFCEIFPCSS